MRKQADLQLRSNELDQIDIRSAVKLPLTATARVYAGPGVGLAEIQATVEPPQSTKGKILAVGVPRVEVQQVLSTALRIPGLVGRPDYNVTTRLVACDKYQPSFGMAVTMAIVASYVQRAIPDNCVFFGEIDLHRDVRGGTARQIENLRRSIDSSEVSNEITLFLPSSLRADSLRLLGVRLVPCTTLVDVIAATWQIMAR